MEHHWVLPVLLLTLGAGLVVLEVFFPSAGILGFLAACSILAAILVGFMQGPVIGFIVLSVAVVGLPVVVILAFKYWPRTAMGRRVLLFSPDSDEVLPEDPQIDHLRSIIGQVAETKCKMLPAGAITLEGRTVDAVSEGMPIEAGKLVRIIEVRANRVVVRPLDEEELSESAEDPLRRPIDAVVPDPFDDEQAP